MPRKSTFFYPKIPTGLVINVMKPNDVIRSKASRSGAR